MNIGKLPPFMAMTLGLLGSEACMTACLDVAGPYDYTSSTVDPDDGLLSSTGIASTGLDPSTTGADTSTGADSSTGSGTDTGTGSDTGTGTGSGSDTDSGSGTTDTDDGGMQNEPPTPDARAAALQRVSSRGTLPTDVLERLRALTSAAKR